jgi:hypothetical protein
MAVLAGVERLEDRVAPSDTLGTLFGAAFALPALDAAADWSETSDAVPVGTSARDSVRAGSVSDGPGSVATASGSDQPPR